MPLQDQFGCAVSTSSPAAVTALDRAAWNLMTMSHDPVADVQEALAADPGLVMGHCLHAALQLLGTERQLLPGAKQAIAAAVANASHATDRERGHIAAVSAFAEGSMEGALGHWERVLTDHPEDALAMYCAHQGDFFLARSSELRDRVARRLPSLDPSWKGFGLYQGMHAFGLEEMNQYAEAEAVGRQAVARCPRDVWAIHAVAHVMEMTARVDDGINWLDQRRDDWAKDSFFQVHNWWHFALYVLDQERYAEALALFDAKIRPGTGMLDRIDASALLWRIMLQGADTGDRWQGLAADWEPNIEDRWYGFNDTHAMMAFAAAGRHDLARRLVSVLQETASMPGENGANTRAVSLPFARALLAFAEGRHAAVVDLLLPIRLIATRGGGSHAQRDLITQTLIRSAELAGQGKLAVALLNERVALRPQSHVSRLWRERAQRQLAA